MTNADLFSSNEELQCTNEELNTTSEELRSTNEQILFSNKQLANKIQELEKTNTKLQQLMYGMDSAILFLGSKGEILNFSEKFTEICSVRKNDLGRSLRDFTPFLKDSKLFWQGLDQAFSGVVLGNCQLEGNDGRIYDFRVRPLNFSEPEEPGVVVMFVDITPLKTAEKELIEAKLMAEDDDAAKTQLLANVSHELRTPLNAIIGFTDLMSTPNLPRQRIQELTTVLRKSSHHLHQLIDTILDFTVPKSNSLTIDVTPCSLANLFKDTTDFFTDKIEGSPLSLKVEIDPQLPDVIMGSPFLIQQVLINLVGNAIKFTSEGSICIKAARQQDTYTISVKDSGIGISPEELKNIFRPLYRGATPKTKTVDGRGLGLAIVNNIVEVLKGKISVESTLGVGSSFVLELPLIEFSGNISATEELMPSPTTQKPSKGLSILIAEDDEPSQLLFKYYLEGTPHTYKIVDNGHTLVEEYKMSSYDLVLTDIQLEGMSGTEACRAIRELGGTLPIIAISAHGVAEYKQAAKNAGISDFLVKPLRKSHLLNILAAREASPFG